MYFITTIEKLPNLKGNTTCGATRCVGYYETFNEANETVINNECDICEYLYDYCVIEKVSPGLYQYAMRGIDRWFYKFNDETKQYDPIDEPEEFAHLVGLGIG
jgi:hypothetical protein